MEINLMNPCWKVSSQSNTNVIKEWNAVEKDPI